MNGATKVFLERWRRRSDINELLPFLFATALSCDDVVEFGLRVGESTSAFLAAGCKVLSIDKNPCADTVKFLSPLGRFKFRRSDSLQTDIPECDLLFIDTYHSYTQLSKELARHGDKAKKFIALHDTHTFGSVGEDKKTPGLRVAIDEFLTQSEWKVVIDVPFNNGLVILKR